MSLALCHKLIGVSIFFFISFTDTDSSVCQNLNIAIAYNASVGINILLTTSTAMDQAASKRIEKNGLYLPPECGARFFRCNILQFQHGDFIYYIIPSVRKLIVLSHSKSNLSHASPEETLIEVAENCNPTKSFYAGEDGRHRIFVACMNLPADGAEGTLSYLEYYFSPNGSQRGSILRNTRALTRTEPIYRSDTVSEVVFVRNQEKCSYLNNLYFIDDSYVLRYPAEYGVLDPQFVESGSPLKNCDEIEVIENYDNDNLIIRCYNGLTALYDTCDGDFTYNSLDRVPYPCSNWDVVLYQNGTQLKLEQRNGVASTQDTLELPYSDFSYGTCVDGQSPSFVGLSSDGAVFIAALDENNVTKINEGRQNCYGNHSKRCYRPVFSDDRQVFGVYDVTSKEFLIVNLTVECKKEPVILRYNMSTAEIVPDLVAISLGDGRYNCSCQQELDFINIVPAASLPSPKVDTTSSPAGPKNSSDNSTDHDPSVFPPNRKMRSDHVRLPKWVIPAVVIGGLGVILIVSIIISVFLV